MSRPGRGSPLSTQVLGAGSPLGEGSEDRFGAAVVTGGGAVFVLTAPAKSGSGGTLALSATFSATYLYTKPGGAAMVVPYALTATARTTRSGSNVLVLYLSMTSGPPVLVTDVGGFDLSMLQWEAALPAETPGAVVDNPDLVPGFRVPATELAATAATGAFYMVHTAWSAHAVQQRETEQAA